MDYRDYKAGASSEFFWFRGKRGLIRVLLEKSGARKPSRILNVGAGTGEDISVIGAFGDVYVVDSEREALDMTPDALVAEKRLADVCSLGYPDGFFDTAVAFDLLEHVSDDARAVGEITRVLRPGGCFVFTVPAFNFLFSAHDRRLGHLRRYNMKSLEVLLSGFQCREVGYWMSALFFPLAAHRLFGGGKKAEESFPRIPVFLDSAFYRVLAFENRLMRAGMRLPVGTTIYGICTKPALQCCAPGVRFEIVKYGERAIKRAKLELWDNPAPERDYEIDISFPEFTCLCPRSGYPDFATIKVNYVPDKKVVELKSLKLYLNSFRDVSISHEEATNKIYEALRRRLRPRRLEVVGDFNPRGNVKTVIRVSSEERKTPAR